MTTTESNAGEQRRGRHAKSEDADRTAAPDDDREPAHADTDEQDTSADDERAESPADDEDSSPEHEAPQDEAPQDEAPQDDATEEEPDPEPPAEQPTAVPPRDDPRPREEKPEKRVRQHAIAHHPAGSSLLTAAGLVTGLALVPLVFDQLRFEVAGRAAAAARSAAAPWPSGGEPWFWPGWVATLATVVAVVVLVVAALGLRLPDIAVLVTAVVLAVSTARAAWATLDVLNAHLWELVPTCIVCLGAFGSAVAAAFRWRSGESTATGAGTGEVAGVTLGAWLLVVLLFLGGSAIASSAQTHAAVDVTSPEQNVAGLLSVRAADAPRLHDLRGDWVPQVGAAQVRDDAAASAYAVAHRGFTSRFPTLLARGDDLGAADLDDSWWVSLAAQPFRSKEEAAAWCSASGITGCAPRHIG